MARRRVTLSIPDREFFAIVNLYYRTIETRARVFKNDDCEAGVRATISSSMEPPIFIQIDENPNCAAMDGLVFQPKAAARAVKRVRVSRDGVTGWYDIVGLEADSEPCPATASPIDDSGDGSCYLVSGGAWGLKLSSKTESFGEPYIVLGGDGADLEFL